MSDELVLREGTPAALTLRTGTVTSVVVDGQTVTSVTTRPRVTSLARPGPRIVAVPFSPQDIGEGEIGGGTGGDGTVIAGAIRYRQRTPSASWYFTHPFGRIPDVVIYIHAEGGDTDEDLELVEADPEARPTYVSVQWPTPMTGLLLLS